MITRKLGPALAAGCTDVIKTAEDTPFTANAILLLGERAGIPKGVINSITALDNIAEIGKFLWASDVVKEILGPLASIFIFEDEDEVINIFNKVEVGQASYVFTQDVNRVARIAEQLHFGMVAVNTGVI
ncbi:hypothetical protein NW762_009084 [Fusarium torreyae]|uniref:Aldehyde dehydrogenase domain-containing protein n=1 Tax=Fusarium torreyae TaxID=1237075 RepID=A0A9W8VEG4_9HYPO|nr:hypothetical protein NW762_009084 [Fusarium torreyae]